MFAKKKSPISIQALVLAGGSLEDAVEWLSQHQEDADIDTPLSFEQYKAIGGLRRKEILPPAIQVAIQNCVCTFAVTGKTFCPQGLFCLLLSIKDLKIVYYSLV